MFNHNKMRRPFKTIERILDISFADNPWKTMSPFGLFLPQLTHLLLFSLLPYIILSDLLLGCGRLIRAELLPI